MIDLSLMSKQEKIIIAVLLAGITLIIFMMLTPAKVRNDRRVTAQPQNILATGGAPGSDRGFFNTPKDMGRDKDGNIYIVDTNNHRIQKFTPNGTFLLSWGRQTSKDEEGAPPPGSFRAPCGIDVADDGTVYVADTWNGRVQVFSSTGGFRMEVGRDRGLWGPRDVAVDRDNNIYIADTGNGKIEKFDDKGRFLATFGVKGGGTGPGEFIEPFGLTAGRDNNLYVLDRKNFRVQVLTLDGKYIRQFKVDGWHEGQIVDGCLMEPYLDIDWDSRRIYITDATHHRVIRYDLNGKNKKYITEDSKGLKLACPVGVLFISPRQILATDHSAGKILSLKDE